MSVAENASPGEPGAGRTLRPGPRPRANGSTCGGYLERFRVKTPSLDQPIRDLSGGNQQKVILAKWLATGPRVLLLDEPTRGIDIQAKKEIYALIDELTDDGLAVVVVSSELPEILAVVRPRPRHVRGPRDRRVHPCRGDRGDDHARGTAEKVGAHHAERPPRDPGPVPVADRAGADGPALSLLSDRFFTPENGWNILRQISVNLCLSIGMTLIILAGGIDLSVGAVLALAGAVAAGFLEERRGPLGAGRAAGVHRLRGPSLPGSWSGQRPAGSTA